MTRPPGAAGTGHNRYAQCDDTCTTDCGACKGVGRPAVPDLMGNLQRSLGLPERPAAPVPHADPTDGLREAIYREIVLTPAEPVTASAASCITDALLSGPLAPLLADRQTVRLFAICRGCGLKPDVCSAAAVKCCPDCTHTSDQLIEALRRQLGGERS